MRVSIQQIMSGLTALAAVLTLVGAVASAASFSGSSTTGEGRAHHQTVNSENNTARDVIVDGVALTAHEAAFIKRLNDYRESKGLNRLTVSQKLTDTSREWSKTMAETGRFEHGDAWNVGENILQNSIGTSKVNFEQWKASAGHNENMLRPNYETVGYGQVRATDNRYYATTQFQLR